MSTFKKGKMETSEVTFIDNSTQDVDSLKLSISASSGLFGLALIRLDGNFSQTLEIQFININ